MKITLEISEDEAEEVFLLLQEIKELLEHFKQINESQK